MNPSSHNPAPPSQNQNHHHHPSLTLYSIPPSQYIHRNHLPWHAVAVGALIFNNPRAPTHLLLLQRAGHDSWPYRWEVPGGGVGDEELGESILGGLAREVREETGLRVVYVRRMVPVPVPVSGAMPEGQDGKDGQDTTKMAHVFWNSSKTKLIGKFVFEVCVADAPEVDMPPVVLDEREHCDFLWATEDVVRSGRLELTGPEQRDIILEGFRLARNDSC
ncbi:hypothetical protein E4U43_003695 [Claviceps pusilla]|uniref:Nudix hydrolase domain-containing protein n=1 Tax=Claviceps pusilla TaxID=123648 RepID=A0A9P7NHH8_9HYPO|nr:hypothetical protein E4U43_003695 [Claviceps pusilla]